MKQSRIAAAALTLLAAGCSTRHADSVQATRASSDRAAAVTVGIAPLRRISIASETVLTGTLNAVESTSVGAAVGGRVTTVAAHIGDVVSAGQVLVQIDDSQYQGQLVQAGAAVGVASALGGVEGDMRPLQRVTLRPAGAATPVWRTLEHA